MKSNKSMLLALAAALLSTAAAPAFAEDKVLPGEFSGSVSLLSDYVLRGISQTDEAAALQGSIDWSHDSGIYLGVWGSNVDFNEAAPTDGASAEVDLYAGYASEFGALSYDIGIVHYAYPGADAALNYDFVEGILALGYSPLEGLDLGAKYAFSPDFFLGTDNAHYLEGQVAYGFDIGLPVSLGATVGHQWIENNTRWGTPDYMNWSATASVNVDGVDLGVTYHDTDLSKTECFAGADFCDARAVAFVAYGF